MSQSTNIRFYLRKFVLQAVANFFNKIDEFFSDPSDFFSELSDLTKEVVVDLNHIHRASRVE